MDRGRAIARLRVTGIVFVATIALMAIVQAAVFEWRFRTAPVQTELVSESGLRSSLTMAVLFRAAAAATRPASTPEIAKAVDALVSRQRQFSDLSEADAAAFDQFVATARAVEQRPRDRTLQQRLETQGLSLYAAFDRDTAARALSGSRSRVAFRNFVLAGYAVTLFVALLLYVLVMRPRHRAIGRAMEELEDRRERFAAMFDNSSELMAVYDVDGSMRRANRSAIERLGFGPDLIGRRYDVHIAPHSRDEAGREFAKAVSGEAVEFASTFLDVKGNEVPVQINLCPVVVRGKIVGVVGAARDATAERIFEEEISRSHERFRSLFTRNPNALLAIDASGIITDANTAVERLTGYPVEELVGRHFSMIVPPGSRAGAHERFLELVQGSSRTFVAPTYTRDGHTVLLEVDATPIRVAGKVEGVFYMSREASKEMALRRQLNKSDERVRTLLKMATLSMQGGAQIDEALLLASGALGMQYGIVVSFDRDGSLTVRHRYGPDDLFSVGHRMPPTEAIGRRLAASAQVVAIDDLTIEPYAAELRERALPWGSFIGCSIAAEHTVYGALVFLDRNVRNAGFTQADNDFVEVATAVVGAAVAREMHRQELQGRATHDKLTGLANRALLEEQFNRMIARAKRKREPLALYYIDLDGFKPINDTYGHAAGDEVLCEVARRFARAVRSEDVVARLGGDEFVIVQSAEETVNAVNALSERLMRALEKPVTLASGIIVEVGASIGIAIYPEAGRDLEQLLQNADTQMYGSKRTKAAR